VPLYPVYPVQSYRVQINRIAKRASAWKAGKGVNGIPSRAIAFSDRADSDRSIL